MEQSPLEYAAPQTATRKRPLTLHEIVIRIAAAVLLPLLIIVYLGHRTFGWDGKYADEKIVGKSYQQIVATFGQPRYDNWKVYGKEGQHAISYYGPAGQTYVIRFDEGEIANEVTRLRK